MGAPQGEAQIAYARTSTVPALSLFESTLDPRAYQPVGTFDGPSVGIDWMATMSRRLPFVICMPPPVATSPGLHSTVAGWLLSAGMI